MSDRIVVMDRGRIAQIGTPSDLHERPATPFIADFVGDANLIRGTVAPRHRDISALPACPCP